MLSFAHRNWFSAFNLHLKYQEQWATTVRDQLYIRASGTPLSKDKGNFIWEIQEKLVWAAECEASYSP